ncbi:uncharacterized protein G2W53_001205 [Senna tora]|uniref:Uncharacterized protein n=1 Tax=Senna tora TaxID=362788 RepID=A0A834XF41_9FABA|nr:uncharacterized protein G2W53_001205 [Senna tora]
MALQRHFGKEQIYLDKKARELARQRHIWKEQVYPGMASRPRKKPASPVWDERRFATCDAEKLYRDVYSKTVTVVSKRGMELFEHHNDDNMMIATVKA